MITPGRQVTDGVRGVAGTASSNRAAIWTGLACVLFTAALSGSWVLHRRLDAFLDHLDTRAIDQSAQVLKTLSEERRSHLTSAVGLLSEDARIRAMVMTPTFDQATAHDLLTDIKETSKASVVAILDGGGRVRSVIGAPELHQVDLGTSALVKEALKLPSARVWAFPDKVGVLAAAPVKLGPQVRALFLMGFEMDSKLLAKIEQALGTASAIFVGSEQVASSGHDPDISKALASAAELEPGTYRVVGTFLASSSRLSDSAGAATVAWLVPLHRDAPQVTLLKVLCWLPALLMGLMLALHVAMTVSQPRTEQSPGQLS